MTTNAQDDDALDETSTATGDSQLFRAMQQAEGGSPRIAPNHLGVRIPNDIQPDTAGNVIPNTGGMSVTPHDPMDLPLHRLPLELGGTSRWPVWWILDGKLPATLAFRPDPRRRTHGYVEPSAVMSLAQYQAGIEGTAPTWNLYNV